MVLATDSQTGSCLPFLTTSLTCVVLFPFVMKHLTVLTQPCVPNQAQAFLSHDEFVHILAQMPFLLICASHCVLTGP